jgi:glycine cleavage system P protein (glycine dehydrogenase) subunit 1
MRYLPHSSNEIEEMLETIGVSQIDELFTSIPKDHQSRESIPTKGLYEYKLKQTMESLAGKNRVYETVLAGGGAYFHSIPAAVDHIISRTEFLTAYTPYQPEVSQGTLQAVFEFQTMVAELMGLDVANASLYDAGSGLGEALLMAVRIHKNKRKKVLISKGIHPAYLKVVNTMLNFFGGIEVIELDYDEKTGITDLPEKIGEDVAALALGYPNFFGVIEPIDKAALLSHDAGALFVTVVQDAAVLGTLTSPGELGADICVAEGMSIAGTYGMGGPGVGLMACRKKLIKQMPGRIAGETIDANEDRGYVLTLATREQHIRRERATSNICSNQALVALAFAVHMSLLGADGLNRMNNLSINRTNELVDGLCSIDGIKLKYSSPFINEFIVDLPGQIDELREELGQSSILFGIPLKQFYPDNPLFENSLLIAVTETVTKEVVDTVVKTVADFYKGEG